jgi:hypothetical protein
MMRGWGKRRLQKDNHVGLRLFYIFVRVSTTYWSQYSWSLCHSAVIVDCTYDRSNK